MPPEPVRLADFTVRLFLPGPLLADEERVAEIVQPVGRLIAGPSRSAGRLSEELCLLDERGCDETGRRAYHCAV